MPSRSAANLKKSDATTAVDAVFDSIHQLAQERDELVGFEPFRWRCARPPKDAIRGRVEKIQIAASKQPKFKPVKASRTQSTKFYAPRQEPDPALQSAGFFLFGRSALTKTAGPVGGPGSGAGGGGIF